MKARNPWSIILTRPIAPQIFDFIRKVVIKSKSKFGLSFCADNQEDTFSFTNMKRAVTDLSKLAAVPRTDIENYYFSRKSKGSKKGDSNREKAIQGSIIITSARKQKSFPIMHSKTNSVMCSAA